MPLLGLPCRRPRPGAACRRSARALPSWSGAWAEARLTQACPCRWTVDLDTRTESLRNTFSKPCCHGGAAAVRR